MISRAIGRRNGTWAVQLLPAPLKARVLHGVRLAAAVVLALFVAYALELENAFWAGITAAVACQPSLGNSLQKGRVRLVGTVIGRWRS